MFWSLMFKKPLELILGRKVQLHRKKNGIILSCLWILSWEKSCCVIHLGPFHCSQAFTDDKTISCFIAVCLAFVSQPDSCGKARYLGQLPLFFPSHPQRFSFLRPDVCKLKFEGKTFYVIGTQKEVRYCFPNYLLLCVHEHACACVCT